MINGFDKFRKMMTEWGTEYSVYPYNSYTINELLFMYYNKINEVIDNVNLYNQKVNDFVKWIEEEGIKAEVEKQLLELMNTDYFENLINQEIFGDLWDKVTENTKVCDNVKLERVNVVEFGADRTGVNPSSDSINNAIAYALENNISNVHFPLGTYLLDKGVAFKGGLKYTGFNSIIKAEKETSYMYTEGNDFEIDGLIFDANNVVMHSLYIEKSQNFKISNTIFKNATKYGLHLKDARKCILSYCKGDNCGRLDFMSSAIAVNGNDIKLIDCECSGNTKGNGFLAYSDSNVTTSKVSYINCTAKLNIQHGFLTNTLGNANRKVIDIMYTNCVSISNGNNGMFSGFALHYVDYVNMTNCCADDNKEHGIVLMDGNNFTIHGNTTKNNGLCGIRLQADWIRTQDGFSGVKNAIISNNIINFNGQGNVCGEVCGARDYRYNGILVEGNCHYIQIFDNQIDYNKGGTVYVKKVTGYSDCTNIYVEQNNMLGNQFNEVFKDVDTTSIMGYNYISGGKVEIRPEDVVHRFDGTRKALNTIGTNISNFKPDNDMTYYGVGGEDIVINSFDTTVQDGTCFYVYLASGGTGSITLKSGNGLTLPNAEFVISKTNGNNEILHKVVKLKGTGYKLLS